MGLLDKLWDDTLAGPQPETGLGRLRKLSSFSFRQSNASKDDAPAKAKATSASASAAEGRGSRGSFGEIQEPEPKVTRSIMIKRPPGWSSPSNGTPPVSPAGSTPPNSPFSGGSGRERNNNRLRRKSTSDAYDRRSEEVARDWSSSYPPFEV